MTPPPPRSNLPIIQHLVAWYKTWHESLPHVPKDSRYTLGTKIDSLLVEVLGLIFTASYLGKNEKLPYVRRAMVRLDLVKFFLQILWEIKGLDNKKYIHFSEGLNEIGKMLGGWIKQLSKENPASGGE